MNKLNFFIVPEEIALDKKLGRLDANLYGFLYCLENSGLHKCIASNKYLAKKLDVATNTISKSLTRLERCGYIKREFTDNGKKNRASIRCLVRFCKVNS